MYFFSVGSAHKRRWTEIENPAFKSAMQHYIKKKVMPPRAAIDSLVLQLGSRTEAQVRTKVHNLIKGKQKPI